MDKAFKVYGLHAEPSGKRKATVLFQSDSREEAQDVHLKVVSELHMIAHALEAFNLEVPGLFYEDELSFNDQQCLDMLSGMLGKPHVFMPVGDQGLVALATPTLKVRHGQYYMLWTGTNLPVWLV